MNVMDLTKLRAYFASKDRDNIMQGEMTPDATDTYDLGRTGQRWKTIYAEQVIADSLSGTPTGDHGGLAGLGDDDHTQYVHMTSTRSIVAQHQFAPASSQAPFTLSANAQGNLVTGLYADQLNKQVIAGAGLTTGGYLTSDVTLNVGAGNGVIVSADSITLDWGTTPNTIEPNAIAGSGIQTKPARIDHIHAITTAIAAGLDVTSTSTEGSTNYFSRSDHTHSISTSSNPSTTEAILATDSNGHIQLDGVGIGVAPLGQPPLVIQDNSAPLRLQYNGSNFWDFYINSGGDLTMHSNTGGLTISAAGDLTLNLTGDDVLPSNNYDINLGAINKKYLTLYAAELRVETLVAQDTIATIGGRMLVGPTTTFAVDLPASSTNLVEQYVSNPGFETAGGGGADVFANWIENANDGSIVRSTTKYAGSYSAALTAGTNRDTNIYQNISVTAEDTLLFSFWARGSGSNTQPPRYRIYDVSNGSDIKATQAIESYDNSSTSWFFNKYVIAIPVNCSQIRIFFYCPNASGDVAYFDDVLLMKGRDITVEHANTFAVGDILYSEGSGNVEFFYVIDDDLGGSGIYTVQRNLDGTGYNTWYAGDAIFNTGTVGYGFIDLYSYDSILGSSQTGPTIVGWVRETEWFNDLDARWAIGNLDGLYGYATDTYGIGLGDYSIGEYLTFDPTNGIRMFTSTGGLTIGVSGIRFLLDSDYVANRKIIWIDSNSDEVAYVLGRISSGNGLDIQIQADATQTSLSGVDDGKVTLWASSKSTGTPSINLIAQGTVSTASFVVYGGTASSSNHVLSTATYNQFTGPIYLVDGNTKLAEGAGNAIRLQTNSGFVDIGPQNTSWCHVNSDRANYYFYQGAVIGGSAGGLHIGSTQTPVGQTLTFDERTSEPTIQSGGNSGIWAHDTPDLLFGKNDSGDTYHLGPVIIMNPYLGQVISGSGAGFSAYGNYIFYAYYPQNNGYPGIGMGCYPIPNGWAGQTIRVDLYYSGETSNGGTIYWVVEMEELVHGVTQSTAYPATTVGLNAAHPGVARRTYRRTATVSLSNFSEQASAMSVRLMRYAYSDTYTDNAFLHSVIMYPDPV